MYISELLEGMRFEGHVVVKTHGDKWVTHVGGGTPQDVAFRFGYYHVKRSCVINDVLILWV